MSDDYDDYEDELANDLLQVSMTLIDGFGWSLARVFAHITAENLAIDKAVDDAKDEPFGPPRMPWG